MSFINGALRRMSSIGSVIGVATLFVAISGCGEDEVVFNHGGGSSSSGDGGAGGGVTEPCEPGSQIDCYDGPDGTVGVGLCVAGTRTCNSEGTGYGACAGQVLPTDETCDTTGDDDCDGLTNEDGCSCEPGTAAACYSAPPSTEGVGVCHAGSQICNDTGTGYGTCEGEVTPSTEDCATAEDEDCDSLTPPCQTDDPIIDIRADGNRDGVVDLSDPDDDDDEDTWDSSHGAVFLANLDDDQESCPTSGSDTSLPTCHDAADSVVNGDADLLDMARLKTAPWPDAPTDASATITLSSPGDGYVRLFKGSGTSFSEYTPGTSITSAELQAGIELAIEGIDIVRDDGVWDGFLDVTLNVDAGTGPNGALPDGSDTLRMRLAPVIFRHHLDEVDTYYVTRWDNYQPSVVFRNDLATAAAAAQVPNIWNVYEDDQWTQDFFETAYMAMPTTGGGVHAIHINFRSANYTSSGGFRDAGRVVFTTFRGRDIAGAIEYDSSHQDYMDTLNSFGNLETIPPYGNWPLGRVVRGGCFSGECSATTSGFYPDQAFDGMVSSQGVQDVFYLDTSFLLVGHVDETISYVKASSPRGWVMLAGDPALARSMLEAQQASGYGNTYMFTGKYWSGNISAQVTINQVLSDTDVMNESAWAAAYIDDQVIDMQQETGITDSEIVSVPFLWMEASGWAVAYQPGTINSIYLSDSVFGAPDPHGPYINGSDIFKSQLAAALQPYGVDVHWIEDWDLYHRLDGEVHCGSNSTRVIPTNIKWWETGL